MIFHSYVSLPEGTMRTTFATSCQHSGPDSGYFWLRFLLTAGTLVALLQRPGSFAYFLGLPWAAFASRSWSEGRAQIIPESDKTATVDVAPTADVLNRTGMQNMLTHAFDLKSTLKYLLVYCDERTNVGISLTHFWAIDTHFIRADGVWNKWLV